MNIFVRELKANYKGLIIWTACTLILTYVSYWEYGLTDVSQMASIFNGFPDMINTLFGVSPLGMNDILGYAALIVYYIYFAGLIYAMTLGSKIVQKELDDQTSEFLFTKPVARAKVLKMKTAVAKIYMLIFIIANFAITAIMATSFDDSVYNNEEIVKYLFFAFIGLYILMLVTYMVTLAASTNFKQKKMSMIAGGGFILYSYASSVAILSFEQLNDYTILSPWRYFSLDILINDGFSIIYLIICLVLVIGLYVVAVKGIKNKTF